MNIGMILRMVVSLVVAVSLTRLTMWVITAGLVMAKLVMWVVIFLAFFYTADRLLQNVWPSKK